MTTTIHNAADPASAKARLMALLDDAAEKFSQPRSVTFVHSTIGSANRMRCFVVDVYGEIVCIDAFLATNYYLQRHYRPGQGFIVPPSANAAQLLFGSLSAIFGVEIARTITIREVR